MTYWLTVAATLMILGVAFYFAVSSPKLWAGFVAYLIGSVFAGLKDKVKPKNWTQEQLDRIAMGEDPFNISPLEHDHWLQRQAMKNKVKNKKP